MEYKIFIFILQLYCMMIIDVKGEDVFSDQCKQVSVIDCLNSYKPEGNETVCCSDFKVYNNLCFFAQQKCKDPSLTVLYPGHCVPVSVSPTPGLVNTTDSTYNTTSDTVTAIPPDPILEAFCANKDEIICQDDLDPICGTDNKFYKNKCFFAQQKCKDPSLTVLYPGHCLPVSVSPTPGLVNTTDSMYNTTSDTVTAIPPDPILAAFCANKDEIICQDDLDPICGTDNKFYKNNCEFAMARCDNVDLGTQNLAVCKTAKRVRMILRLS